MFWKQLLHIVFGGSLAASPLPDPMQTQASMDELLTYECAKSVALMLDPTDQVGPVFSDLELVFTGIEAADNSRFLLVSAGQGIFAIPLTGAGVNRVRFSVPSRQPAASREYFMSFLFDPNTRSRVFDFSAGRPPGGKQESDYRSVVPRRSEQLLPNLEYRIHETAESMLAALTEGHLNRLAIVDQKARNCEHITRKSPNLGRNLKRNLDVVEKIVIGPKSKPAGAIAAAAAVSTRAPASVTVYAHK